MTFYPEYIYLYSPLFTGGLVALAILFKIYKRSISGFISIIMVSIVSTLLANGSILTAMYILLITAVAILARSMLNPDNDHIVIHKSQRHRVQNKQDGSAILSKQKGKQDAK